MILAVLLAATLDTFLAPYEQKGELAAVVVRDGRVEAVRNGDRVFRVASLSKVVTAYAILESGANLHAPTRYGVTLHQLLTHTSGIDDAFFGNTVPVARQVTLEQHFRDRPPRFGRKPGETVVYSNEGITLAAHLVAGNEPFEQFVARHVFIPLGMTHSTFVQPPPFDVVPSGAEGERLIQAPAGAMVSTANDMARFLTALLSDPELRKNRYALFEYGGALYHTGRSGHESVIYLNPEKRTGLFLVHTGGLDRELRKRFVRDFGGWTLPPPSNPRIEPGTYRPFLLPVHRIERAAHIATDTSVRIDGDTITVRMPPFAMGQTLVFENGQTSDGYLLTGGGRRFTIAGPLFDPVTFERVYVPGRVKLLVAFIAFLIVAAASRTRLFAAVTLLFVLAPVAFLANYLPRSAETRPFHVAASVNLGVGFLLAAAVLALAAPLVAWKTRRVASIAALVLGISALHLLCPCLSF